MQVDRTLTSGDETSVGEVEVYPVAFRARCSAAAGGFQESLVKSSPISR